MGTVAILSVGDELLAGDLVDGNAPWLAQQLAARGHRATSIAVVGDEVSAVAGAVRAARAQGVALLLVTGGLGPTLDDLTREGVAEALGLSLAPRPDLAAEMEAFAAHARRPLTPGSYRQVVLPDGAVALPNPRGTAPGFLVRDGGFTVACLPGVPSEMRPMARAVLDAHGQGDGVPAVRLHGCGLPESELGERLGDLMIPERAGCRVGVTAHLGLLTVAVRGEDPAAVARAAAAARAAFGEALFGEGEDTLQGVVVAALAARGLTLTCAESCTGGLLAGAITSVPGASAVFRESVVTYADAAKTARLAVPAELLAAHGAVSEPVARAMAEGARAAARADVALAVTGIAGPDGGTPDKPVGTVWFGLADATDTLTRCVLWKGSRDEIRMRAVHAGLEMIRRRLR